MAVVRIGIVTTSDRASRGQYEDQGTPELEAVLRETIRTPFEAHARLLADEQDLIERALVELVDHVGCCLVVTTGGTGPARRDVTVEATLAVGHKAMPGFGELMRKVSLEKVPTAILSRQEAVVRFAPPAATDGPAATGDVGAGGAGGAGGALIVNLPGSIKAIRECLLAVMPAIPYCIDLLGGPSLETNETIVKAFRPKK